MGVDASDTRGSGRPELPASGDLALPADTGARDPVTAAGEPRGSWLSPSLQRGARVTVAVATVACGVWTAVWQLDARPARAVIDWLLSVAVWAALGSGAGLAAYWCSERRRAPCHTARPRSAPPRPDMDFLPGAPVGAASQLGWTTPRASAAPPEPDHGIEWYVCQFGRVRGPCTADDVTAALRNVCNSMHLLIAVSPRGPWYKPGPAWRDALTAEQASELRVLFDWAAWLTEVLPVGLHYAVWALMVEVGPRPAYKGLVQGLRREVDMLIDPWDHWTDALYGDPLAPADWRALVTDTLLGHVVTLGVAVTAFLRQTRYSTLVWARRHIALTLGYVAVLAGLAYLTS